MTDIHCVQVQSHNAISGHNALAHETSIHQNGMIKNPLTYEIMTPQSVGVSGTSLVLGKHSGRHALGLRCEKLGFRLERHELDKVYRHFVALADATKTVDDNHILELIRQVKLQRSRPIVTVESPLASVISSHNDDRDLDPGLAHADLFKDDSRRHASSMALGAQ